MPANVEGLILTICMMEAKSKLRIIYLYRYKEKTVISEWKGYQVVLLVACLVSDKEYRRATLMKAKHIYNFVRGTLNAELICHGYA